MNSRQTAKLASYRAVEALLKATTETSGIPGLPASLTALSARLDELDALGEAQLQPTNPKVARRDELLQDMVEATLAVAGLVSTHAHRQKLTELGREMDVTEASFRRVRRDHRPWMAQRIHDLTQPLLPQLAALGVTAETLADLQAKIDALRVGLGQPRSTIVEKRSATDQMRRLFQEVDALVKREIDRQLFPLRKTSPQFYAAYQAARHVARRPQRASEEPQSAPAAPAAATPASQAEKLAA